MNDVHLIGAEQVQRAASTMSSAASDMQSAANSISCSVDDQRRMLDDFLMQFRELVEQLTEAMKPRIEITGVPQDESLERCQVCAERKSNLVYFEKTNYKVCPGDCYDSALEKLDGKP